MAGSGQVSEISDTADELKNLTNGFSKKVEKKAA